MLQSQLRILFIGPDPTTKLTFKCHNARKVAATCNSTVAHYVQFNLHLQHDVYGHYDFQLIRFADSSGLEQTLK